MKTKISKKQAEELLKNLHQDVGDDKYVAALCGQGLPIELRSEWNCYWKKINKTKIGFISESFCYGDPEIPYGDEPIVVSLTRLLTAHMFIDDTYK